MTQRMILGLVGVAIGIAMLCALRRLPHEAAEEPNSEPTRTAYVRPTPTHAVTDTMEASSRTMLGREAPTFSCAATDGEVYDSSALLNKGPLVLTFTKIGCPCSTAAQPFFNEIADAFPNTNVLGVVDAAAGPAKLWMKRIRASYPHLLDPDLTLVRGFKAENSAYVVVIDPEGQIIKHWPGISRTMFAELCAYLAQSTHAPAAQLDWSDVPSEIYSGCPFDL